MPVGSQVPYSPFNLGQYTTGNASEVYANWSRMQFAEYVNTYAPLEDKLIEFATDTEQPGLAMERARETVGTSFDNQAAANERRLQGLGLTLESDERHAADRSRGLSRALASAGAQNRARDATIERQNSILGTPVPGLGLGG